MLPPRSTPRGISGNSMLCSAHFSMFQAAAAPPLTDRETRPEPQKGENICLISSFAAQCGPTCP